MYEAVCIDCSVIRSGKMMCREVAVWQQQQQQDRKHMVDQDQQAMKHTRYARVQVRPKKKLRVAVLRLGDRTGEAMAGSRRRCRFLRGLEGGLRWSVGMIGKAGSAYLHFLLLVAYQRTHPNEEDASTTNPSD